MNSRVELSGAGHYRYIFLMLVMTLMLILLFSILSYRLYKIIIVKAQFPETPARVLFQNMEEHTYMMELNIDGNIYKGKLDANAQFYDGQIIFLRYNPDNPTEVYYEELSLLEGWLVLVIVLLSWFILKSKNDPEWLIQHSGHSG